MKDYITNNKNTILLLIIAVLALYNIFNTNSVKVDVKGYKQQIETIQGKVDSAQVVNQVIDNKIQKVDERVISVTKEIHHIDNTITEVKHITNEKIDNADNFGVNELELFFANRYK